SRERLVFAKARREPGIASADEAVDRARRENPNSAQRFGAESLANPLRSTGPEETRRVGSAVGLLGSLLNPRRKNSRCPPAQYFFLAQPAQAGASRQRRREFIEAMIEKRKASLDSVRHR